MTGSACPPWCVKADCDGNHEGAAVAAAVGMSLTAGEDVAILVTPIHEAAEGLGPELYIADQWVGSDWAMQLSTAEARRLGQALLDSCERIDPAGAR